MKRPLVATCIALVLATAVGGCAVRSELGMAQPNPFIGAVGDLMRDQDREDLEALAAERVGPDAGYRIGPDDLLDIRIPDLLENSGDSQTTRQGASSTGPGTVAETPTSQASPQAVRVSADGMVRLPLLGLVPAVGLTPTALEDDLARRLVEARILRTPQVSVLVGEYRSRVVAVVGSVERPGLYPLTRPGATLADLIWAAGGPSKDAGRIVNFVPARAAEPQRYASAGSPALTIPAMRASGRPIRVDVDVLLHATGDKARVLDPPVRPGDVITVSPAGSMLVDGWVDKPGSYPVTRGLTLTGAVAAAGGHLFAADRHHVTVKRVLAPDEQRYFTVDLDAVSRGQAPDFPITDGDVVRLPASAVRLGPWAFWALTKELFHAYAAIPIF